jgi:Nif-specific regulatory protein
MYSSLIEIFKVINSSLDFDRVLDIVLENTTKLVKAEASSLILLEPSGKLYFKSATGSKREEIKKFKLEIGEGIAGWVVKEGKPLLVPDVTKDPRFKRDIAEKIDYITQSIICVPLITEEETIGALELINSIEKQSFDEEDLELLSIISHLIANSIKNAIIYGEKVKEIDSLKKALGLTHTIVGESEKMKEIILLISKIGDTDVNVLIQGETGTGKELVALAIHENSLRKRERFIEVNCAAIPDTLIESELFGYEKGAFTGATTTKKGKFELAHKGTIFLDEVGDLSLPAQAKLLRVIQEKKIDRVGGSFPIPVDVRIIAATNKDLEEEMERGRFRDDLYYRLNEISINLPPLRERKEDIPLLVNHFLKIFNKELNRRIKEIPSSQLRMLMDYHWPGNIRQLRNLIKRAVILSEGRSLEVGSLISQLRRREKREDLFSLEEMEKFHIERILSLADFNKKKCANILKISRPTLDKKIEKYKIKLKVK